MCCIGRGIATLAFADRFDILRATPEFTAGVQSIVTESVEQPRGRACKNVTMDDYTHDRIRDAIASVPRGKVASYGDIAAMSGAPSPRIIGWVLKEDGADLPWHRIVRADGTVAKPQQLPMLRNEGLDIPGSKIDMARYRWNA